jgi:A/G-specific adenine glycosylase
VDDALAARLLPWYREHRRDLSFRRTRDPYATLVAEVLLQRTRIVSGLPYFERFIAAFPTVAALAAASEEQVLKAWEGLGFYGRARHLHRAAKAIVAEHGGRIPGSFSGLRELPGIGDYTAGAVASIAFGERVPAVDGNAIRVLARVFRLRGDLTRGDARRRLNEVAARLVPTADPGAFNQALMELGATLCRPRAPRCPECPLHDLCGAYGDGEAARYPEVASRPPAPVARVAFALARRAGRVLLVKRPPGGLLSGLWALPGGETGARATPAAALRKGLSGLGARARIGAVAGHVDHAFSHRRWVGDVFSVRISGPLRPREDAMWAGPDDLVRLPIVPFHRRFLERLDGLETR